MSQSMIIDIDPMKASGFFGDRNGFKPNDAYRKAIRPRVLCCITTSSITQRHVSTSNFSGSERRPDASTIQYVNGTAPSSGTDFV